MQDGLPLQAERHAAKSLTAGVAIGLGLPAGAPFVGLAWVPAWRASMGLAEAIEMTLKAAKRVAENENCILKRGFWSWEVGGESFFGKE